MKGYEVIAGALPILINKESACTKKTGKVCKPSVKQMREMIAISYLFTVPLSVLS